MFSFCLFSGAQKTPQQTGEEENVILFRLDFLGLDKLWWYFSEYIFQSIFFRVYFSPTIIRPRLLADDYSPTIIRPIKWKGTHLMPAAYPKNPTRASASGMYWLICRDMISFILTYLILSKGASKTSFVNKQSFLRPHAWLLFDSPWYVCFSNFSGLVKFYDYSEIIFKTLNECFWNHCF